MVKLTLLLSLGTWLYIAISVTSNTLFYTQQFDASVQAKVKFFFLLILIAILRQYFGYSLQIPVLKS